MARGTGITAADVVSIVGQGGLWTRQGIAAALGRGYSTYVNQAIELAVAAGWVAKQQGISAENRLCWVYSLPAVSPRLEGL